MTFVSLGRCKSLLLLVLAGEAVVQGFVSQLRHNVRHFTRKFAAADNQVFTVHNTSCVLEDKPLVRRPWRKVSSVNYKFDYSYNELVLAGGGTPSDAAKTTTCILLIHPIGVGIGRWFYNRLLKAMQEQCTHSLVVLAPDLLACGSASHPFATTVNGEQVSIRKLPLLNTTDWSNQLMQLMADYETQHASTEIEWCIVSNGGCVPIALDIGQAFAKSQHMFNGNLTHVVLSAPPRLSGLLSEAPNPEKVQKSYRTLSGIVGKLFWWYALRKEGRFIQQFSEGNLVADPANLGDEWTPTCVKTAKSYYTRYSTFAFLAGALQMSCRPAFEALQKTHVSVNVIVGGDKRKNPARSWFWEKKRRSDDKKETAAEPTETLADYLQKSHIRGARQVVVRGRRCPAHEDARGFANAVLSFLF